MSSDAHTKLEMSLSNLERALKRLEEALAEPATNSLAIDGTIQRFEFVIELFWKTFRRALLVEGIETKTPKESLVQAYQVQWIEDDGIWLAMLKDRNETSHIYDEEKAKEIYERIQKYFPELKQAFHLLKNRFSWGH